MRISRTLTAAVAGALAVGAFTACPSAGAAAPESPNGTKSATMARAFVTVITEVKNATDYQVSLYSGEDNSWFSTSPIDAHSTKTGTMRVPWVGNPSETNKNIQVYKVYNWNGEHSVFLYDIFQDYWEPNNQVKYGFYNSYDLPRPLPVPGDSTGGGKKRLIIASDRPYMEAIH